MNLDLINEYCLNKHCVLPNTQIDSISDIARNHIGLHSARIMTPFMTLCSRMNSFDPKLLINKLYLDRELIKLRCMRTTLHIVPIDMASIVHKATIDMRLAECRLFFKRNNISVSYLNSFNNLINESLEMPLTADELEKIILKTINFVDEDLKKVLAKKLIKYYWETGVLCYINTTDSWEKEERKYALTQKYYPNMNLDLYDCEEAKWLLVLEYIKRFGPATLHDLSWWSGLNISYIRSSLQKYDDSIMKFDVDKYTFYILKTEYDNLQSYKRISGDWVSLLAYEDPALKGYFESRLRYVAEDKYNLLFNQIGEVRASILYNGKAVGIWEWDKKIKKIKLNFFSLVPNKIKEQVNNLKKKYEEELYPNQQLVLWDF